MKQGPGVSGRRLASGREKPEIRAVTSRVLSSLAELGVLLRQDKQLPNVVTLVTGERLSSSWWSHPKGRLIFRVLDELSDHSDVLVVKLIDQKDTFVHRKLWAPFLAVATSRESWQLRKLSPAARALLRRIDATDRPLRSRGPAVKELMARLLVHGTAVHTESGRHEMAVESWPTWARGARVAASRSASSARAALERSCEGIGAARDALPWTSEEV
ncbi:MAG TPA: hypothetical protein VJA66_09560 [Thermoanaerobaculia bacterium]